MKAFLEVLKLSLILVVAFLALLVMASTWILPGKVKVLAVLSGSMEPVIHTGSVIVSLPIQEYRPNTIITYARGGDPKNLVTHRISATDYEDGELTYVTKGDANKTPDPWKVSNSDIVGRVVLTIPFLGRVITWVKTPVGFIVAVVLPAAIIIYHELLQLKNALVDWWKHKKGIAMIIGIFALGLGTWNASNSTAFLLDTEVSTGNTIGIATDFALVPSNTPTSLPTQIPTFTPTPTNEPVPTTTPTEVPSFTPTLEPTPTFVPTPTATSTPLLSPLVNEFLANGVLGSTENDEWIEIYNPNAVSLDLSGWKLDDDSASVSSTPFVMPNNTILNGFGFLTFTKSTTGITLNNSADTVRLLNPSDLVIDSQTYTDALELITQGRTTDGGLPWKPCTVSTPGTSNNGSC